MQNTKDKIVHNILAKTLRFGVVSSMGITIFGLIIYFIDASNHQYYFKDFVGDYKFNATAFAESLCRLEGTAIMFLGVLLLMITPILRIIFSIIGFVLIKDKRYVLVGLTTFLIIAISVMVGYLVIK